MRKHFNNMPELPGLSDDDKRELVKALRICKRRSEERDLSGERDLVQITQCIVQDCLDPRKSFNRDNVDSLEILEKYFGNHSVLRPEVLRGLTKRLDRYWGMGSLMEHQWGRPLHEQLRCLNALDSFLGNDPFPTPERLRQKICDAVQSGEKLDDVLTLAQYGMIDLHQPGPSGQPLYHDLLLEAAKGAAGMGQTYPSHWHDPSKPVGQRFNEWAERLIRLAKLDPNTCPLYQNLHAPERTAPPKYPEVVRKMLEQLKQKQQLEAEQASFEMEKQKMQQDLAAQWRANIQRQIEQDKEIMRAVSEGIQKSITGALRNGG